MASTCVLCVRLSFFYFFYENLGRQTKVDHILHGYGTNYYVINIIL